MFLAGNAALEKKEAMKLWTVVLMFVIQNCLSHVSQSVDVPSLKAPKGQKEVFEYHLSLLL